MSYETTFEKLNAHGVKYLVVGGVAVNLWGAARMTQDLDLVVDLSKRNLLALVEAMNELGLRPRAPVEPSRLADASARKTWIDTKGMKAFSFFHPGDPFQVIDVLIADSRYKEFSRRSRIVMAGPVKVPLVSLDDLITMKTESNRRQDQADVETLRKIKSILGERT